MAPPPAHRTLFCLAAAAALVVGWTEAAAAEPPAHLSTSEVNLVTAIDPARAELLLRVAVFSGSAADPPGAEGLAWLTAMSIREEAGAGVQATVDKDLTLFSARGSVAAIEELLPRLARAVAAPQPAEANLAAARIQRREALDRVRADPDLLCREAFDWFVLSGTGYAHPAAGVWQADDRLTADAVRSFHAEHYRKGNLAIGLAGPADPKLAGRARDAFSPVADGSPARPIEPPAFLPRPRVLIVASERAVRPAVLIGHPITVTRAHPDYLPLAVPLGWLSSPESGRPPRRRLVLSVAVEASADEAAGAIRRAWSGLADQAAGRIDPGRLADLSRQALAGSAAADSEATLAARWEDYLYRSPGFRERLPASLAVLSIETIRSALQRHLHPDRAAAVVVVSDPAALKRRLLAEAGAPGLAPEEVEIVREADLFR